MLERLREYTLQDLIALGLPYMVLSCIPLIGVCFIIDPTMKVLLYSALPEGFKNDYSFWICFLEEMRFLLVCAGMCVPTWQLQVISFELVSTSLETVANNVLKT